jgi:UDP-glucose:glycoprotein glucosyltransferase
MPTIGDELQRMQMLVQRGKMRGKKKLNILSIILKGKNVHERYNAQVLQADAEFTPLLPSLAPPAADLPLFLSVEKDAKQPSAVVSALVVADFSTPAALRLALVSLEALSATASMRVALVHNGNSAADAVGRAVRDVTLALALRSSTADDGAAALDDFKRALGGALLDCATGASSASKCTVAKLLAAVKATAGPPSARVAQLRVAAHGNACASWLKLDAGVSALVVNGRVLRLDPLLPTLQVEDIVLAVATERKRSAKSVAALLRKSGASADAVMATASVLGAMAFSGSVGSDGHTRSLKLRQSGVAPSYLERTVIRASEDAADDATVEVFAILDPLSETAQRASGVLTWLRETMGPDRVSITIVLNPSTSTSELPLSRFYRFVGGAALGTEPTATFLNMPGQHLLTMKIETPEAWIVQASEAEHDLDNIRLGDETLMGDRTTLHATFAMKKLLATGQCHDVTSRVPPNGLQLNLFDASTSAAGDSSPVADTLVMQNLGYFQLQAVPGRWHIKLAEGRATELFEMAPADETSAPAQHLEVLVHDFVDSARMSQLSVRKQAGKEMEELLVKKGGEGADGESGGSLWSKMSSLVTGKKPKSALETGDAEDETVHVFSLASGHLYERLMRIMMLSVTKRTSAPVKFWLVENFLSPHFKRTVFEMAEKFGFEVELITYKWPEWLRRQTEKQRIIWGYKILFLDVLFPLNVHKIIYVDADQVVLADLKELWDLDLQGAPCVHARAWSSLLTITTTVPSAHAHSFLPPFSLLPSPLAGTATRQCAKQTPRRLGFSSGSKGTGKSTCRGSRTTSVRFTSLISTSFAKVVSLTCCAGPTTSSVAIRTRSRTWTKTCRTMRSIRSRSSRCRRSGSGANRGAAARRRAKRRRLTFGASQHLSESGVKCTLHRAHSLLTSTPPPTHSPLHSNNPLHKEPKLDMAKRIISGPLFKESWVELDDEVRSFMEGHAAAAAAAAVEAKSEL